MSLTAPLPAQSPPPEAAPDGFLVSAIGSCRVAGPLRKAAAADGVALNQSGIYGYCHSSCEALQQIKALRGECAIPQELEPIVAPSGLSRAAHLPSDFYFIELCSAKHLSTQGYAVQLNYVTRHFEDFFSCRERSRGFWRRARAGDRREMQAFLLDQRAYWSLNETDRALLRDMRLELAAPDILARDIAAIVERVPAHLFVTHFNARKRDGALLRARADYIALTQEVLRAMGLPFFDPSDYVEAYGAGRALRHDSHSLTHYTEAFESVLFDNWHRRYLAPAMAGKAGRAVGGDTAGAPAHLSAI